MRSRKPAFIVIGLGALFAVPLLWSLRAEAKSLACAISNGHGNASPILFTFDGATFSLECEGEGMRVQGQGRAHSGQQGIQVNLIVATGTTNTKEATALGYNSSRQFIPGCIISDTNTGGGFNNLFCNDNVLGISLSTSGTAP